MEACGRFSLGYGIVAPGTARMTPEYSLNSKNTSFESTVFLNGFNTILGAGRDISAFSRSHQGRDAGSVCLDQKYQYLLHFANPLLFNAV